MEKDTNGSLKKKKKWKNGFKFDFGKEKNFFLQMIIHHKMKFDRSSKWNPFPQIQQFY